MSNAIATLFNTAFNAANRAAPMRISGVVVALKGLTVLVQDLPLPIGALVSIRPAAAGALHRTAAPCRPEDSVDARVVWGEVVGFTREHSIVMLLGQTGGIRAGDRVVGEEIEQTARVGSGLLGRVVDGLGRPIDGREQPQDSIAMPLSPEPINALTRRRIQEPFHTGLRAIDLFTTLGKGQRMGVFAGPGVGKSTLLGTIARRGCAHVNVIALIGERGREVKDFIEHSLGPEGMARSIIVVATGDESPLLRIRAARLACTAAEYFRDRGLDVMLMMDSVTRFAHAQRQIGLSIGEPPATKGYTPSVFSNLALLLERAGCVEPAPGARSAGTITGLYTILVEGDDMTEPVADAARGILDGHLVLSRKLAQKAHYPAIDVLDSVSRVADDVTDADHIAARQQLMRLLALYRDVEDLVQIGAYSRGSNPEADIAIDLNAEIVDILRQGKAEQTAFAESKKAMISIVNRAKDQLTALQRAKGAQPRR